MKCFLFVFVHLIFFIAPLNFCYCITLSEQIQKAKAGDFVVLSQGKNNVLLHINHKDNQEIVIEEVTIPAALINYVHNWKTWIYEGASHHTSWILYKIDLAKGNLEKAYSVTKNSWIDPSNGSWFLPTLLKLKLNEISEEKRSKVGLAPIGGSPDFREAWNPKVFFEGQEISKVKFNAYKTFWPQDNSELSGKVIEVYLPAEKGAYPSYLPYWIQIKGNVAGRVVVRVVDSGVNLVSPYKSFSKFNPVSK